jgi:Zn-finger nucleic acid-binding protein
MAEVTARATPGRLIQLDQCKQCGGIWCDKWELFPLDGEEAEKLDPIDEDLLRNEVRLTKKTLYCPRCADELAVFADPILPQNIQLQRCRHCDGLWLNRGQFRRYKGYQQATRKKKMSSEKIATRLPEVYADPNSWVVTGTKGIFAYPAGMEANEELPDGSFKTASKAALHNFIRMLLGL